MIIATLLGIIVKLLTGGHKSPFITPDLQKRVRKNVKDPDRKKRVLEILKTLIAAQKRLDGRSKLYMKMIASLVADRETSREELTAVFRGLLSDHSQTQKKFINGRLAVVGLLTAEEFEKCIDRDRRTSDKEWKKLTKSIAIHLNAMDEASAKAIDDPVSRESVRSAIEDFGQDLDGLMKGFAERNYHDDEVLGRYDAGREELIADQANISSLRERLYRAFIDLHQSLAKATTAAHWKNVAKAMDALAK